MTEIAENTQLQTKKDGQFGRAFSACINHDWAIQPEYLRNNVLAIAARLNDPKAVEAYREQDLENTSAAKIRNGVAIIFVTGPIFRYANFFTYYSGGTTVAQLAKDFRAALDNPEVYSIMFEFNTPGGEVTGISELGDMIFAARKRKPMTARVGGLMCSAGLWLGSQAGDVVLDKTAMVGSLGVCTAYIDDRKRLEMHGLEELEFISSQSPYKNAPAWTDEGKKRIQARIDALCQVFGEAVARGRGVSIKTVWDKFGQGDVFVGQEAIDCGLADRFGSYEETIEMLAKAHTPHYVSNSPENEDEEEEFLEPFNDDEAGSETASESAPSANASTINDLPAVTSKSDEAEVNEAASEIQIQEENMSDNNIEKQDSETAASNPAPQADAAALDARERDIVAREAQLRLQEEAVAKTAAEAAAKIRRAEFAKTAEAFAGDEASKTAKVDLMEKLADTFGADSDEFSAYVKDQQTLAAQIATGQLFGENGASGEGDADASAEEKLEKLAKARAAEKGITYEKAYTEILGENQNLFAATQKSGE